MSKIELKEYEILDEKFPDSLKAALLDDVPAEPGFYKDNEGTLWLRAADGHWYDKDGDTHPLSYNWLLYFGSPYTSISSSKV